MNYFGSPYIFIATCKFGMESELAFELKRLGAQDVKILDARVLFSGDFAMLARANLWLRIAERIFWQIATFKATSFEELFEGTVRIPWHQILEKDACFPVKGKSAKSQLHSVSDCQAICKKAIVKEMQNHYGIEWFPETGRKYIFEIGLLDDQATISIDASGAGLSRRGYRLHHGEAPLSETLAAGLLGLCRWHNQMPLYDPFCGSGTIALEAAMIAQNIAPGSGRIFAAEEWSFIKPSIWNQARVQARDEQITDIASEIFASDIDSEMIEAAKFNAKQLNLKINFTCTDIEDFDSSFEKASLITNPPFGERLLDKETARALIRILGEKMRSNPQWQIGVLSPDSELERNFGRRADKRRKVYHSNMPCQFYQYFPKRS